MRPIRAVLFDLDGTLLDTAHDLFFAMNRLREVKGLHELSFPSFRSLVSLGSKAMLKHAFDIDENHADFNHMRQQFLQYYEQRIAHHTQLFPAMDKVLSHLQQYQIPWGIVTNKPTHLTHKLLKTLAIKYPPSCIICGDTLAHAKPHPAPILHACELLKLAPQDCLYIGDSLIDVTACKAAGLPALIALYGYIDNKVDPLTWDAHGYIREPIEIIDWL